MHHCTICSQSFNVICHVCTHSRSEQKSRKLGFGYICVIYEHPISRAHKLMIVTNVWATIWKIMFCLCLLHTASLSLLKVIGFCLCHFLCCTTSCGKKPFFDFLLLIFFFFHFHPVSPPPSPPPFFFFPSLEVPPMCAEDHGKSLAISVICHALWWTVLISRSSVYGRCQAKRDVAESAYTSA